MNIWALDKDVPIKLLLILLSQQFGADRFVVSEDRELHFKAVRLMSVNEPKVSAYIYSYGQTEGTYGLHLEYPLTDSRIDISSSADIYEGMSTEQMMELLEAHFEFAVDVSRTG
jgi:hypothetical protein